MVVYKDFIGIDIGKFNFVVAVYNAKETNEYENSASGIAKFLDEYQIQLTNALCILETTGGYEMELLLTLCHKQVAVHRANTRKVKYFIRSYGNDSKTDSLDAKALARYGRERCHILELFTPASKQAMELYELVKRRQDLTQILIAEKNRRQGPLLNVVKTSCETMIKTVSKEIEVITETINSIIEQDPDLKKKKEILKGIPGIGEIISNELVVLLPELGQINRKRIASLVGLAPRANDSGQYNGYRATGHGRSGIKPMLFMAAMAARNSNSRLKEFYERLIASGKRKWLL